MRALAAALILLAGCTTGPAQHIEWRQLEPQALAQACSKYSGEGLQMMLRRGDRANGCYRREGSACVVYTRAPSGPDDVDLHRTLGHEARHCFEGLFH